MKKYLILLLINVLLSFAYDNTTYYVLAKSGLNLRAEASTSAKVLTLVPYGESVTILVQGVAGITIDGVNSSWCKVKYKDFTGFLVNIYLIPHKVPLVNTKSIDDYFAQVTTVGYKTDEFTNTVYADEGHATLRKVLFKNGMEIHHTVYYDATGGTYFFPNWEQQTVFLLLKQIHDFKVLNDYAISFPTSSKTYKKGVKTVNVKVSENKILISYVEDSVYDIIISFTDNQVVVKYFRSIKQ